MEIELSMDTGDILDEFLSLLEWDVDGLELLEYFSDVSYMWEVWTSDTDIINWNNFSENKVYANQDFTI